MPNWTELTDKQRNMIISMIQSFSVEGDDLEETEGMKLIGKKLATMIAIEAYHSIRLALGQTPET